MTIDKAKRAIGIGATGLFLACALAAPAASAKVTKSGGLTYVTSGAFIAPGDDGKDSALCPAGTSTIGGGSEVIGALGDTRLGNVAPFDYSDSDTAVDDGWYALADNVATTQRKLKTVAVCTRADTEYVTGNPTPIPAGGAFSYALGPCPSGMKVVSGGASSNSNGFGRMHMRQSGPSDSGDPNAKPEGWQIDVANKNTATGYSQLQLVCAAGKFKYVSLPFAVPKQYQVIAELQCPGGTHVVGGGILFDTAPVALALTGSRPIDGSDSDRKPDDAWRLRVDNLHVANAYAGDAYRICRK